ncbi:MAG: hypothetical protein JWR60_1736 [Polaromonas sp.]|nr:hypothetical protein [Polaromonas sp.]
MHASFQGALFWLFPGWGKPGMGLAVAKRQSAITLTCDSFGPALRLLSNQ